MGLRTPIPDAGPGTPSVSMLRPENGAVLHVQKLRPKSGRHSFRPHYPEHSREPTLSGTCFDTRETSDFSSILQTGRVLRVTCRLRKNWSLGRSCHTSGVDH